MLKITEVSVTKGMFSDVFAGKVSVQQLDGSATAHVKLPWHLVEKILAVVDQYRYEGTISEAFAAQPEEVANPPKL